MRRDARGAGWKRSNVFAVFWQGRSQRFSRPLKVHLMREWSQRSHHRRSEPGGRRYVSRLTLQLDWGQISIFNITLAPQVGCRLRSRHYGAITADRRGTWLVPCAQPRSRMPAVFNIQRSNAAIARFARRLKIDRDLQKKLKKIAKTI